MAGFLYNLTCPQDVDSWNKASTAAKCVTPNVYHCLKTSDGQFIETCVEKTWIQPGMCPEYNTNLDMLDVDECQGTSTECPDVTYWSNDVYQYATCLQRTNQTQDFNNIIVADMQTTISPNSTTTTTDSSGLDIQTLLPYIIGGVILIALVFVVLLICILCRRKRSRHREYRHDIKIEYSKREHNQQDDLIQDAVDGNNLTNGDSLDAEKRPFIDHYSDVSSPSPTSSTAPKSNITVYVGDDPDKIAVAYEHLVYENRYDKCQFVKDINELKVDRWTKVYFIQDIFRHVIHSSDIDKMRGALDEIYLAAGQQPLSMFILEMPLTLWTEHRKYLQEMALFHDQHISFV